MPIRLQTKNFQKQSSCDDCKRVITSGRPRKDPTTSKIGKLNRWCIEHGFEKMCLECHALILELNPNSDLVSRANFWKEHSEGKKKKATSIFSLVKS